MYIESDVQCSYLLIKSAGRASMSKRHILLYASELTSIEYFPGLKQASIMPPPFIKLCRANALISIVYLIWGCSSLNIGCIELSCL